MAASEVSAEDHHIVATLTSFYVTPSYIDQLFVDLPANTRPKDFFKHGLVEAILG